MSVRFKRTVTCTVCGKEEWADLQVHDPRFVSDAFNEYPPNPAGWAVRQKGHGHGDVSLCSPDCKARYVSDQSIEAAKAASDYIDALFTFPGVSAP